MMMLEKNSDDVIKFIVSWIQKNATTLRSWFMKNTSFAARICGRLFPVDRPRRSSPITGMPGATMRRRSSSPARVVEIKLTNPHSIVVFDAPDPSDGKVVRWQAEMGGGQQLVRQFGWNKDNPKIGDKITLNGRKVKSGAPYMNMTEKAQIVLTDSGKEIYRHRTSASRPAAGDVSQRRPVGLT